MSIKDGIAKGSCRSIPPVHLYHALEACRLALIQFGGHAQAAGLTMEADKVDELRHLFTETVKTALHGEIYEPEVEPDYFIPEGAVTEKIVHEQTAPTLWPEQSGSDLGDLKGPSSRACALWERTAVICGWTFQAAAMAIRDFCGRKARGAITSTREKRQPWPLCPASTPSAA